MKIESNDLISAETERSARNLTIVSCIVLVIWRYDLKTSTANIFGIELPAQAIHDLSFVLVLAMTLGHFLHWWGDFASARKWFKRSNIERDNFWKLTPFDPSDPPPEAARLRFQNALVAIEKAVEFIKVDPQTSASANDILEQLQATRNNLNEVMKIVQLMGENFRILSFSMWGLLVGWYLILPVSLAAISVFVSLA